ncbi:ATP-binding cassette domain-containing protein [Blastococcus sp. KM273128]|uniref:ABC transporter ATP-binding protein n=1 Tax=Blastococcus sp. KM273128 TaxID=2570314 RepID=UPI001EFF9A48|nr:ATP-binding cassette domain-containing protein [Blastococcus sp. KM273128]MCF6745446.1 ATP-binding cassette domain-containing protein [Blastococcus sp. KM273128]
MAAITFDHATLVYPGASRPSVDALDLEIADGEFLVLVGPSGCGKSTSLRMLAGLEEVTDGTIRVGDRDVTHLPPKDRDIAMVFQVAMGRAIVRQPQVFLMDEPLSNLDAKLRVQTRTEIAALQRRLGVTTVYVTHDQVEAMTMGDRVAVLSEGVLQQVDTPRNLYDRPANVFVAGFIGSPAMNIVPVTLTEGGAQVAGHTVPLPREALSALAREGSSTATLGFRPESVEFVAEGQGIPVEVLLVEELGSDAFAYGRLAAGEAGGEDRQLVLRADPRRPPMKGEVVHVGIRPGEAHLFSAETGLRVAEPQG